MLWRLADAIARVLHEVAAGVLQGLFTQLCSHVVIHTDTLDAAIEAVQHCRQVR